MRIDMTNIAKTYAMTNQNNVATVKDTKSKSTVNSDRLEFSSQTSVESISKKVTDSVVSTKNSRVSSERLEMLKERIANDEYFVSSMDVARAMMK